MGASVFKAIFLISIFLSIPFSGPGTGTKGQDVQTHLVAYEEPDTTLKQDIDFGRIPLYFIPNQGQVDASALYYASTSSYTLWITRKGLIFDRIKKTSQQETVYPASRHKASPTQGAERRLKSERDVSRLIFLNARENPEIIPVDAAPHVVSFFTGKDKALWKSGIPTSRAVLFKDIYAQVDLKVHGVEREIEYDFIIKPGGNAADIGFEYCDVEKAFIDDSGDLALQTAFGEIKHTRPVCYQIIGGERREIEAGFKKRGENFFGFEVDEYDRNHELVIDPVVMVYSTYLGGASLDQSVFIDVDMTGAVYLTGWVESKNFPLKSAIIPAFGGEVDAFITKLSPEGNAIVYSTYLGGSDRDGGLDIIVDETGAAYVTGMTKSADFPTYNAFDDSFGGSWDVFGTKLDTTGTALVYSTYLGGQDFELGRGIRVDRNGSAYVNGGTWSIDFPIKKAFQKKNAGASDAFLSRLNPDGNTLVFSTYFGGSGEDTATGLALDANGNAYLTGDTLSSDLPTKKAFQKKLSGDQDNFVAKLNKKGKKLRYSSYLGGREREEGRGIAVDAAGNAYVSGSTMSPDFPTVNPLFGQHAGGFDIYVTMFRTKGKNLFYSTFLGGPKDDFSYDIAVDHQNYAYVRGNTESRKFPTKNALFKKYAGGGDVVVVGLDVRGRDLLFSTFLGGSGWEGGYGIAVDSMGGIYVAGGTGSVDFPLKKPLQKKKRKNNDIFVTKLRFD